MTTTHDRIVKEGQLARDALKKMGYIKTSWGWVIESRVTVAVSHGLIRTEPVAGFTKKGARMGWNVLRYLYGDTNQLTDKGA